MSNLNDIFNAVPTIEQPVQQNLRIDEFNPSAKSSKSGNYTAIVRFIMWHKDPQNSIVSKVESYVTDPLTKQSRVVDSLKNFQSTCPINDTYWTLQNTKDAALQAFAKKHINTYKTHASLVQIIKDDVHPENVGKILVWRYKQTIWDKLYNETHPQYGTNPSPFDLINGRYFAVNVCLKSGFNNYDNCQFINSGASGMYVMNNGQYTQVDANTDRQLIYDFLVNNSPDLSKYEAKQWDEKTAAFVNSALENINRQAQYGSMPSNIAPLTNNNIQPQSPLAAQPIATTLKMNVSAPNPDVAHVPTLDTPLPNFTAPTKPTMESNITQPTNVGVTGIDLPPMPNINNTPTATPVGLGLGLEEIVGAM